MTVLATCPRCVHYIRALACEAFPDGIPEPILDGTVDHTKPYPGDSGLMFTTSSSVTPDAT